MIRAYIWGAGIYGKRAIDYVEDCNGYFEEHIISIAGIIDSSPQKIGTIFHTYRILEPTTLCNIHSDYCVVVAVKNDEAIICWLKENDIKATIYTYAEFVKQEKGLLDYFRGGNIHQADDVKNVLERIEAKDTFFKAIDRMDAYETVKNKIGFKRTIACMASCFGSDLIRSESFMDCHVKVSYRNSKGSRIALYYPHFLNGGAERVISELLKLYADKGWSVIFISNCGYENENEYELPTEVQRYYLPDWRVNPYGWIIEMSLFLQRQSIDVLCSHATSSLENYYLGLLLQEMNIRFLITVHNRFEMYINYGPDICQLTRQFRYADELIVMSTDDCEYWNSVGLKSRYIPNPVKKRDGDAGIHRNGNTILWIGRITGHIKNVFDVVDVMSYVNKKLPRAKLKIVGKDFDAEENNMRKLIELIGQAGLDDVIEICGFDTNVDRYYQQADVMILTSSVECFPMVIIEGKSFGVPLVLYELPYLEILKEHKGYKAVPQGDKQAMANSVVDLLNNKSERERLSKEALESLEPFLKIDLAEKWNKVFMGESEG